jgi:hypothetical protein
LENQQAAFIHASADDVVNHALARFQQGPGLSGVSQVSGGGGSLRQSTGL